MARGSASIARTNVDKAAKAIGPHLAELPKIAPKIAGKHPFTAAHLATLRDRGGFLVDRLKPSGAVRDPKGRGAAALVKDRFAKLLEVDYAELLKAAVAIWGVDAYREHVPALYAKASKPKK